MLFKSNYDRQHLQRWVKLQINSANPRVAFVIFTSSRCIKFCYFSQLAEFVISPSARCICYFPKRALHLLLSQARVAFVFSPVNGAYVCSRNAPPPRFAWAVAGPSKRGLQRTLRGAIRGDTPNLHCKPSTPNRTCAMAQRYRDACIWSHEVRTSVVWERWGWCQGCVRVVWGWCEGSVRVVWGLLENADGGVMVVWDLCEGGVGVV